MVGGLVGQILPPAEAVRGPGGTVTLIINHTNYILFVAVSYLFGTVGHSYGVVCWTLFYFDLRIRKEGFDLELMAARGHVPASLPGEIPVEVVDDEPPDDFQPWPDNRNPPLS
jgi:hypothetical protein